MEVTVSQSDWHKTGSVNGESTNHGSHNWRGKKYEKKRSTVDQQSIMSIKFISDQDTEDRISFDSAWKNFALVIQINQTID